MRRSQDLAKLCDAVWRRSDRLSALATSVSGRSDPNARRVIAFVAIEAYNGWVNFEREFYLSCAYLRPRQTGGGRVRSLASGVRDEQSALRYAIPIAKGPRARIPRRGVAIRPADEPDWSQRDTLIKLSVHLSNAAEIQSGLSLQTTFFDHLPTIRIFYAHRAKATADKVRRLALREYGVPNLAHPHNLLNAPLYNHPDSLLVVWLDDMKVVSGAICN